jgi:hypothetical protein
MVLPPFALLRKDFTLNGCFFFFALATDASNPIDAGELILMQINPKFHFLAERQVGSGVQP